jgi:uncharacterized protein YdeI (YjbR/CyaY-like superfamily)
MITFIEDYFAKGCGRCERYDSPDCSALRWHDGLLALRDLCRDLALVEVLKWGHPCYVHHARNIAIIGATRADFRLSFFDAALLRDPSGLLEMAGPNSPTPDMLRFTSASRVEEIAPAIRSMLEEAMRFAEAGIRPPKVESVVEMPEELAEALASDPELAEAFHRLTPGRQKSYLINLNGAKKSATRTARIAGFRDHILAGKGVLDR